MSQLTHPRAQILELHFPFRSWLAVLAAAVALAIPTYLVIQNDGSAASYNGAAPASGLRFDGGPDEGTRGEILSQDALRFDGGPDEGTRP
jgi:hypothetical protein